MEKIRLRLIALRKYRGLSQRELAAIAGVSVVTLNKLERGGSVRLSVLDRLDRALDGALL